MKLSKPVPVIVVPNSLREGIAKLPPHLQVIAKKLVRAKIRRVRNAGPPANLGARREESLLPPKIEPREPCRVLPLVRARTNDEE